MVSLQTGNVGTYAAEGKPNSLPSATSVNNITHVPYGTLLVMGFLL
jgi:hypothetical protein